MTESTVSNAEWGEPGAPVGTTHSYSVADRSGDGRRVGYSGCEDIRKELGCGLIST